jgi:hypothetical protein
MNLIRLAKEPEPKSADELLMGDNFLCMKTWVAQLKDLEDMFLQV